MIELFVTGSTGFVGKNLQEYFKLYSPEIKFNSITRKELNEQKINLNISKSACIIHLAGKAHDLKKTSNPEEYYEVNTKLTENIFDIFLESDAEIFIMLSSVKAAANSVIGILTEEMECNPQTDYGKSKLLAEQYILNKSIPIHKRVYILRPCMIHGPGNKGNLNLLFQVVKKGIPWPLGAFDNKRSFCSIDNLCFVIRELIENNQVPSGIYQVADDKAISTNELISIIAKSQNKKPRVLKISKKIIKALTAVGDLLKLPLNSERLQKLTESYVVCNAKIVKAINKTLPVNSIDGLAKTIHSFGKYV